MLVCCCLYWYNMIKKIKKNKFIKLFVCIVGVNFRVITSVKTEIFIEILKNNSSFKL